jgi:hypothetical protein
MNRLAEIEAAAETLPPEEQVELLGFLAARIRDSLPRFHGSRLVHKGDDALLEAPADAPPMTPENVRRILEDWP